jgi:hypothetical protein
LPGRRRRPGRGSCRCCCSTSWTRSSGTRSTTTSLPSSSSVHAPLLSYPRLLSSGCVCEVALGRSTKLLLGFTVYLFL